MCDKKAKEDEEKHHISTACLWLHIGWFRLDRDSNANSARKSLSHFNVQRAYMWWRRYTHTIKRKKDRKNELELCKSQYCSALCNFLFLFQIHILQSAAVYNAFFYASLLHAHGAVLFNLDFAVLSESRRILGRALWLFFFVVALLLKLRQINAYNLTNDPDLKYNNLGISMSGLNFLEWKL